MRFALSSYGTRGEVEPLVAVGRELTRRGHEVCMAVPPDLVTFVESSGISAVAYRLDSQTLIEPYVNYWTCYHRSIWRNRQDLMRFRFETQRIGTEALEETGAVLMLLAEGADLLLTGVNFEQPAFSVAEYHNIPLAAMHFTPVRVNGQLVPAVPSRLVRPVMTAREWWTWRLGTRKIENAQRRDLGLPEGTGPFSRRMAERGSLEIQAYDEACFPGLASEWAKYVGRRPFVGTLTIELPTESDEDVLSWIASGTPPICFGFGSMLVESAAKTIAIIAAACARLGERALVCAGVSEFSDGPAFDHVKVVPGANYAAVFPNCRAIVHHGGSSTTPIGMRAGIPQLILWKIPDQQIWAGAVKRLRVGTARPFTSLTEASLVTDLRTILAPEYIARAKNMVTRMTRPIEAATAAADLVENAARLR